MSMYEQRLRWHMQSPATAWHVYCSSSEMDLQW